MLFLTAGRLRFLRLACASASLLGMLMACGEDKKEAEVVVASPDFNSLWTTMFENRCSSCHAPAAGNLQTKGGPDLSTQDKFYAALVDKKGSDYDTWETFQRNRADCASVSFISSGDASNSMVVAVLDSSVSPCRVLNHISAGHITKTVASDANLAALKEWINAGAKR
jgi:hypothetical protein